jgi:hypothetical protein
MFLGKNLQKEEFKEWNYYYWWEASSLKRERERYKESFTFQSILHLFEDFNVFFSL